MLTIQSSLIELAFEMLECMIEALGQRSQDPVVRSHPQKSWKEVTFSIDPEELWVDVRKNHLEPCAYVLADLIRQLRMETFPFAVLPDFYHADPDAHLQIAVATDPQTGISLRLRRWHSVTTHQDLMAVDIASEGYKSSNGLGLVGPWMVA